MPSSKWTEVFYFTANGNVDGPWCCDYGDRIPAVHINSHKKNFSITSAINGNGNYPHRIDIELGKTYQITIKQFKESGRYWYEIIIDGESNFKIENTQPQSFSNVKLYGLSNPWTSTPFTSEYGSICNVKIKQGQEG